MKKNRNTFLITSVLIIFTILVLITLEKGSDLFQGLNLVVFILIVVIGVIAFVRALKKDKEEKEGLTSDDELSNKIKYKSGYYSYLASMYLWLFIFLFKDKFPDKETLIGGAILLSAIISFISKIIIKRNFNE